MFELWPGVDLSCNDSNEKNSANKKTNHVNNTNSRMYTHIKIYVNVVWDDLDRCRVSLLVAEAFQSPLIKECTLYIILGILRLFEVSSLKKGYWKV